MSSDESFDILRELLRVVSALESREIPYALCGGLAVAAHGYVRATTDIDIVVVKDDLDDVRSALKDAGFYIDNGIIPFPSLGFSFYRMAKILENEVLMVDVLFADPESSMWQSRTKVTFEDTDIWVLSKSELIKMKSSSERTKDKLDIEQLMELDDED